MRYATTFLHLPKITTFTTYGLCDDCSGDIYYSSLGEWREGPVPSSAVQENYILPLPVGTSTVKEIALTQLEVSAGILDFISACRELRRLVLHLGFDYEYNQDAPLDYNAMAQVLTQHAKPLEELDWIFHGIRYDMYGSWTPIPNWNPVVENINCHCCRLRSLSIYRVDLFEHAPTGDTADYKIVLDQLPKSIEYLKSHCLDIVNTWMSNDGCVEPYLEGFMELLEECGPEGRFSNLRTLDFSETFIDDPKTTDVTRIKTLAESRGVELLLHKAS
ncbi:hypothetical protein NW762_012405 [Fusarium torreyae]|uniref:F-box domain-containing protein n=1 Tax=Fusarium torreyae TaxID=1237075 RepID=A0A9W8V8D1_9HYPO|nr:hypothetical protein NW762_012405 [Fusarium torreyae]